MSCHAIIDRAFEAGHTLHRGIDNHRKAFLAAAITTAGLISLPDLKAIYLSAPAFPGFSALATSAFEGLTSTFAAAGTKLQGLGTLAVANPQITLAALGALCLIGVCLYVAKKVDVTAKLATAKAKLVDVKNAAAAVPGQIQAKVKQLGVIKTTLATVATVGALVGTYFAVPHLKALYANPPAFSAVSTAVKDSLTAAGAAIAPYITTAGEKLAPYITTAGEKLAPYAEMAKASVIANPTATILIITAVTCLILRKPIYNRILKPLYDRVIVPAARGMKNTAVKVGSKLLNRRVAAGLTAAGIAVWQFPVLRDFAAMKEAGSAALATAKVYGSQAYAAAAPVVSSTLATIKPYAVQAYDTLQPLAAAAADKCIALASSGYAFAVAHPGVVAAISVVAITALVIYVARRAIAAAEARATAAEANATDAVRLQTQAEREARAAEALTTQAQQRETNTTARADRQIQEANARADRLIQEAINRETARASKEITAASENLAAKAKSYIEQIQAAEAAKVAEAYKQVDLVKATLSGALNAEKQRVGHLEGLLKAAAITQGHQVTNLTPQVSAGSSSSSSSSIATAGEPVIAATTTTTSTTTSATTTTTHAVVDAEEQRAAQAAAEAKTQRIATAQAEVDAAKQDRDTAQAAHTTADNANRNWKQTSTQRSKPQSVRDQVTITKKALDLATERLNKATADLAAAQASA